MKLENREFAEFYLDGKPAMYGGKVCFVGNGYFSITDGTVTFDISNTCHWYMVRKLPVPNS